VINEEREEELKSDSLSARSQGSMQQLMHTPNLIPRIVNLA
jgi:hypothetical protein